MSIMIPVALREKGKRISANDFLGAIAEQQDHAAFSQLKAAFAPASLRRDLALEPSARRQDYPLLPDTTVLTPQGNIQALFFTGLAISKDEGLLVRAMFKTLSLGHGGEELLFSVQKTYVTELELARRADEPPTPEFNPAARNLQRQVVIAMRETADQIKSGQACGRTIHLRPLAFAHM